MKNLVISVPRLEIHRPPISTAIVAEVIRTTGAPVQALDLNCEFYHFLPDRQAYYSWDEIWDQVRNPTFTELKNLFRFIKQSLEKMKSYDRYWISVFGSSGHIFSKLLCKFIRKHLPNKINSDLPDKETPDFPN